MKVPKIAGALTWLDDDLLLEAQDRKHRHWVALVAACAVLVLVLGFGIRYGSSFWRYAGGATVGDSEQISGSFWPGQSPQPPAMPWDDSLYYRVELPKQSRRPGETVTLELFLGLKDNYLEAGELEIQVAAADFAVTCDGWTVTDGKLSVPDFCEGGYTKEAPLKLTVLLTPVFAQSWGKGTITVTARFLPEDADAFCEKVSGEIYVDEYAAGVLQQIRENGLSVFHYSLGYAMDQAELRVSAKAGGSDLWLEMLIDHYTTWQLSGRAFADLYYGDVFSDRIIATVFSYNAEAQTVRFQYYSKNIRYSSSEMIQDPQIWTLYQKAQAAMDQQTHAEDPAAKEAYMALAKRIVQVLLERGIITRQEYEAELLWLPQAGEVSPYGLMYPGGLQEYWPIRKYLITHEDP